MDKVTELIHQIRHYGTLRFAIFAAFLAITGGLLAIFSDSSSVITRVFLSLFGILSSATFALLQAKLSAYHHNCCTHLRSFAEKETPPIEREYIELLFPPARPFPARRLGKKLASLAGERSANFIGPVTTAVLVLHTVVALMWVILLLFEPGGTP